MSLGGLKLEKLKETIKSMILKLLCHS